MAVYHIIDGKQVKAEEVECRVCKRLVHVDKRGVIAHHTFRDKSKGDPGGYHAKRCPGASTDPVTGEVIPGKYSKSTKRREARKEEAKKLMRSLDQIRRINKKVG